jgi:hypothetical protein
MISINTDNLNGGQSIIFNMKLGSKEASFVFMAQDFPHGDKKEISKFLNEVIDCLLDNIYKD